MGLGHRYDSQHAVLYQTPNLLMGGMGTQLEGNSQRYACAPTSPDHLLSLGDTHSHRLLNQHMFASLGRGDGVLGVQAVGRGDEHRVNTGVLEQGIH